MNPRSGSLTSSILGARDIVLGKTKLSTSSLRLGGGGGRGLFEYRVEMEVQLEGL